MSWSKTRTSLWSCKERETKPSGGTTPRTPKWRTRPSWWWTSSRSSKVCRKTLPRPKNAWGPWWGPNRSSPPRRTNLKPINGSRRERKEKFSRCTIRRSRAGNWSDKTWTTSCRRCWPTTRKCVMSAWRRSSRIGTSTLTTRPKWSQRTSR